MQNPHIDFSCKYPLINESSQNIPVFKGNESGSLQAKDRAHRLGQQKQVMVLVLVCPSTVEEVILEATERKLSLDAKVIQAGLFNEASTAADRQKALQQVLQTNPPPQSSELLLLPY